ncbi:MAG: hypothetical protein K0R66_1769 [Gammaproteobacteria bacterium]|jgi:ankyrin repeat protein|nr:hypothetical protein [Gammaproteobacteria bacterium]
MQGWLNFLKPKEYDSQDASQKMLLACREGNYEAVISLIDEAKKADAKRKDPSPLSFVVNLVNQNLPILKAAEKGRFDIVFLLIQNNANTNEQEPISGDTVLMYFVRAACKNREDKHYNYINKLDELFDEAKKHQQPINPNLANFEGLTPLMLANLKQHVDLAGKLFELGAKHTAENRAKLAKMAEITAVGNGASSNLQAVRPLSGGGEAHSGGYQPPAFS